MKFGQEFSKALLTEGFPEHWLGSAIEYKHLKKIIRRVHDELAATGLDPETLDQLSPLTSEELHVPKADSSNNLEKGYYSAALPALTTVPEEFTPQLRVLVDRKTGFPVDASLAPETRVALRKLARTEHVLDSRRASLGAVLPVKTLMERRGSVGGDVSEVLLHQPQDVQEILVPLSTARDFFDLLEPKLQELEALREAETRKLEDDIMDLGDAIENVVEPVRAGFEAKRQMSYRDLYFWREMFRLYLQSPIFYSHDEEARGALSFTQAKQRLEVYDEQLRETGLLEKMRTPQAQAAAQKFLDVNIDILRIMRFQEMNAKAMAKILKKFQKRTHLEGDLFVKSLTDRFPALVLDKQQHNSGFAGSIARDMSAEISSKVLAIVPQLNDWNCPLCYAMAWKPINLGCCRSIFCIRCIIQLQDEGLRLCPCCNAETVFQANGRNVSFDALDFLQKYFPLEVKRRQRENERAQLLKEHEEFAKGPSCTVM